MKTKTLSAIATAALLTVALAGTSFAAASGVRPISPASANPETIDKLQVAADKALTDGRNGNKNNLEFRRKNYEINQLIERLKAGEKVDPAEIDEALEPVHVW